MIKYCFLVVNCEKVLIEWIVLLLNLFDASELVTFVFTEDGTFGANFFQINNTNDFQRLLMEETQIIFLFAVFWLNLFTTFFILCSCVCRIIVSLRVISFKDRGLSWVRFMSLLGLLLLALLNSTNQLLGILILLKLLLFYDFWNIEWRILKGRFALVRFDNFHQGFIYWELLDSVIRKLACCFILRTDNLKLLFLLGENHSFNACLTECVSAHTENSRCFLFAVFKIAQGTGKLSLHRKQYFLFYWIKESLKFLNI